MGRLIDEDDVISLLTNHHFDDDKENFDLLIHNLCKEVRCIPTAYNVDVVVQQLEKEKETSQSAHYEAIIGMCGASANHYGGKEYAYQRAIEIAKCMSKTHELKIYPKYFEAILDGKKTFEIRKDDRDFHVGDNVVLKEWDNIKYSGREIHTIIKYMLDDAFIGLAEGYVAFSFGILKIIDR